MASLGVAPVLATPDTHIFENTPSSVDFVSLPQLSEEQLYLTYEIRRTVDEIRAGRWQRIALQFPDHMLPDAPRVYQALSRGLARARRDRTPPLAPARLSGDTVEDLAKDLEQTAFDTPGEPKEKLFILADTSYGACCVDEIAAEHVNADVVVHYGRACLSPTARLPVIYVFTTRPLDIEPAVAAFKEAIPDPGARAIVMADVPYSNHVPEVCTQLRRDGYSNVHEASIVHDPSSLLPNRTVPANVTGGKDGLCEHQLFHISEPPPALLLTLASRVAAIHIYPTDGCGSSPPKAGLASSAMALRRRYALVTKLSTVAVFGILINTLSVKNYMHMIVRVRAQIAAAGKKSYTFVVGKVNAAKVANFSEIGGWVVVGCWESSLIESKDFWRPIITPFELSLALQGDSERIWTGEWTSDFQALLRPQDDDAGARPGGVAVEDEADSGRPGGDAGEFDSAEESEPPEFDLRTGRYISHSRPMRAASSHTTPTSRAKEGPSAAKSLVRRANGDLATIGGVLSPGADFLHSNRTWRGLGSDFEVGRDQKNEAGEGLGAVLEQGRAGVARGYVVGDDRAVR